MFNVVLDPISTINNLIGKLGIKARGTSTAIVRQMDPSKLCEEHQSVIGTWFEGVLYICVHGFYHMVESLPKFLLRLVECFYVLHIHYPSQAKSFMEFLALVRVGADKKSLTLSQKKLSE